MEELQIQIPESVDPSLQLPDPSLLQYYQDKQNRVIWMLGEVNDAAFDWVSEILQWNREDKDLPVEERKPIRLLISNYGGSLEEARMLIEIIKLSKTPVYGMAIGICASAASLIYLACHKRYATRNITLMLHQGSCQNLQGSYSEIQSFTENYKRDIEEMTEFYKNNTKFPSKIIDERMAKGDWYIRIDEALENGAVDELIEDIALLY